MLSDSCIDTNTIKKKKMPIHSSFIKSIYPPLLMHQIGLIYCGVFVIIYYAVVLNQMYLGGLSGEG